MYIHRLIQKRDITNHCRFFYFELYKKVMALISEVPYQPDQHGRIYICADMERANKFYPENISVVPWNINKIEAAVRESVKHIYFAMTVKDLKAAAFDEIYFTLPTDQKRMAAQEIKERLQSIGWTGLDWMADFIHMPSRK